MCDMELFPELQRITWALLNRYDFLRTTKRTLLRVYALVADRKIIRPDPFNIACNEQDFSFAGSVGEWSEAMVTMIAFWLYVVGFYK